MTDKKVSIGFQLQRILTEQYAVLEENYLINEDVDLSINLKFAVNKENMLVSVLALVKFEVKTQPFLILEAGCNFSIEEKAWQSFNQSDSETIIIPKGFMSHLSVIVIGTARGILHSKTENTEFNKYFLPTINVTELVKSDIAFT